MRRFGECSTAFASGWMLVRGNRRRRGYDRGIALSDHADCPELLQTIQESGVERVFATHGYADVFARYLREERGLDARKLRTEFDASGESENESEGEEAA